MDVLSRGRISLHISTGDFVSVVIVGTVKNSRFFVCFVSPHRIFLAQSTRHKALVKNLDIDGCVLPKYFTYRENRKVTRARQLGATTYNTLYFPTT